MNELVKKKYLNTFYDYDSKCNLRMTPKLTYLHVYPEPFEKMKV
jgi:hypothetical protein